MQVSGSINTWPPHPNEVTDEWIMVLINVCTKLLKTYYERTTLIEPISAIVIQEAPTSLPGNTVKAYIKKVFAAAEMDIDLQCTKYAQQYTIIVKYIFIRHVAIFSPKNLYLIFTSMTSSYKNIDNPFYFGHRLLVPIPSLYNTNPPSNEIFRQLHALFTYISIKPLRVYYAYDFHHIKITLMTNTFLTVPMNPAVDPLPLFNNMTADLSINLMETPQVLVNDNP